MAISKDTDLAAYERLRKKAGKGKTSSWELPAFTKTNNNAESRTVKSSAPQSSPALQPSQSSDPAALQRLREKVRGKDPTYKSSTSSSGTSKVKNDFNADTKSAYTSAKDKAKGKTTLTSQLSEKDRKARIKEIETELRNLNYTLQGLGRAGSYGGQENKDWLKNKGEEVRKRKDELSAELKTLKRVGTFTASEMKQFEIEDAKAEKAKLPSYNPTARVAPSEVEAFVENAKAHSAADKKINTLEREKALYEDINKYSDVVHNDSNSEDDFWQFITNHKDWAKDFGSQWRANYRSNELSREASKAMNDYISNPTDENWEIAKAYVAFSREYMKNNEKALDDENVKASWLSKSFAGYLPQLKDQIVPELIGGGIGMGLGTLVGAPTIGRSIGAGVGAYAQSFEDIRGSVFIELLSMGLDKETALRLAEDEAIKSAGIEGAESAVSWGLSGTNKALSAIGGAAKASVAKGTAGAATKFAANMASKATGKAAKKAAAAATRPLWKTAVRTAFGVGREAGTEYLEEFSQGAVSVATREKAMAAIDREIGEYGAGNINLHNRPIYMNDDGTMSTVDSVTFKVDDKYVLLPSIVRDENGNAIRLESDEDIFAHYQATGEHLGEFDTQGEADAYANRLHYAQAYYYGAKSVDEDDGLMQGAGNVIWDAITGERPEVFGELNEQGMEGAKIGLMMGGSRTMTNNIITHYANAKTVKAQNEVVDTIIEDEESLDALIEEGKASGEGTVSAKLAEEVEQAKENGKVTREQVKKLIESNEVYIKDEEDTDALVAKTNTEQTAANDMGLMGESITPFIASINEKSLNNEPITVEEAKRASSYGENGATLLANAVNNSDGRSFSDVKGDMHTAYLKGISNEAFTFDADTPSIVSEAYLAGKNDRKMQDLEFEANAKKATFYKGTFTENEYTKNFTNAEKRMISTVAKALKMDVKVIDKVIANTFTEAEANAKHEDGRLTISDNRDAEKVMFQLILHEGGHRMRQIAPTEFGVLMDALYKRADDRAMRLDASQRLAFDYVKSQHDEAGVSLNAGSYLEEIAVRELETIFSSAEEFNKWYAEVSGNHQTKSAWQRFMDFVNELIEDIKRVIKQAKMTKEERAKAKKDLAELERIKELYADALKAAERTATDKVNSDGKAETFAETESGVNYSIREEYANEIEAWVKSGMPKGEAFVLGTTGDVLQGLGAIESDIYMLGDKIEEILKIHPEMTVEEIKKIPQILENPVLILKSQNVNRNDKKNTRLVIYGNVKAQDGRPILSVLDLRPVEKNLVVDDMQKVSSAYTKDSNPIDFIEKSMVVYADKKRTTKLLKSIGFQMPIELQQSGYIGSISYINRSVNIKGENFSNVFKKSSGVNFSLKEKAPTFYSHMGKTIDDMKQDKIGANSVVSYLTGRGVKAEEIKWSGIETFLDGKKSVTKAELQEFVAGSQLQIEENVLSEEEASNYKIEYTEDEKEKLDAISENLSESWEEIDNLWQEMFGEEISWDIRYNDNATRLVRRELDRKSGDGYDTRYNKIVGCIRDIDLWESQQSYIVSQAETRMKGVVAPKWSEYKLDGGDNYREITFKMPDSTYTNSAMKAHWGGDAEGILAHARIQDFDVDGEKMLFIEEIQSDWHNEGQSRGYKNKLTVRDEDAVMGIADKRTQLFGELTEVLDEIRTTAENAQKQNLDDKQMADLVSPLWEKAHKLREEERALKEEAEKIEGTGNVPDAPFKNNYHEYVLKRLIRMAAEEGYDSIGWTPADVQSQRWSEDYAEGYRIEYDQDIPKFLNKYGKKWGAKVGKTEIGKEDGGWYEVEGTTVWSMPITDAMKDSVLYEGQPMYSLKDSEGKSLTKEQQEFFKDSKVRDKDGNLLVVYHGSPSKFTVFNHRYINSHGNAHGRGFYFTEKKSLAEGYNKGGQLLEGYLNIANPLSEDKITMKKSDLLKLVKATCEENARELLIDGGYDDIQEAMRDTWISNYVNTYETSLNDAYREVTNTIWSGNTNDVEIISELTNAGAGNENTLRLTHDILGYDGVIYTAPDGSHEFVSLVSNQFKDIHNTKPTSNPDINFSLKKEESKAIDNVGIQYDSKSKSIAPSFSLKTWKASSYVQDKETAIKAIAKATGVSERDAERYINNINSIARMIADDRERLDYDSNIDEYASVLKSNSEYKWTVDMSTLCAKRLLTTGTFDAIQKALPNTVFSSEDIVSLRSMMLERGYEVACGICYVESTRRELGAITAEFIERYKMSQKSGKPITRVNSKGNVVELKKTQEQMLTTKDKSTDKFIADKNYTPTLAELNTTDIDFVKRDHPLVYEAYLNFMNARGQAKPKHLETRAEYKGEILTHFKDVRTVKSRNDAGGLRVQSFSDFEVAHLIDMMQIVLDMSQVGLKSQAYTKVPEFADVFGNTGMKINLSLIAKDSGLDENGNLIFDDVEGMPHEEAFRLRKKYSKNVGTILVGKNDAHIIAALKDPRIDFVIPFHKSSWKESLYEALGLTGYDDYTDYQNEKPFDANRKIKNFQPSEYWDYSKSGEENAKTYLEMCAEDGRMPKFPQFQNCEGYWKLLIDFKMYDNNGVGSPQTNVMPEFNMSRARAILNSYKGGHRTLPVAQDVVTDFVEQYKNKESVFSIKGGIPVTELIDTIDGARSGKKNAVNKLAKYVDSGAITTELYEELIEKYGVIPSGEKPHRNVSVPRKTGKDKKVSQTVRTILEARVTPDEAVPTIEKMVEDGVFSYDVYTDKQAIGDAEDYIKEYGWEESLDDWFDAVKNGEVSKQITAMGWALYNNSANIAATTTSETERTTAIKTSLNILDAMVRHQRSAAQALQATRILKKLSPETQLYGIQKSVHAFQNELTDKYGDKAPDLKINEELAEQFINAKTPEERAEIEKEIYKDIGRQMPSRFIDKWNAWRYLAMLGNLRTHVRNIFGNAFFAPVVVAKDLTASAIESAVNRVSSKKVGRGKTVISGSKADRELLKAAWGDYGNVADLISNGGKYNDSAMANQQVEEGRQIFKFKPLEWARKKNSQLLEIEDMWFAQPHYAYALAQYCKAHKLTAEQITKGKAIEPARVYAIKEAQKATYRDTNAFSQMVSEWGRDRSASDNIVKKAFSTVIEGILPFRKTPANILVRGVEYSPIGLIKGLSYDLVQVSKGKMTATEAIDNISAGLTGTGLLGLGILLAAQGVVRGHGEDEEEDKKFNELMGRQSYALELPNGQSFTLDWLAPEALPFFVGVNIWETTKGSNEETNFSALLKAVTNISEPMLEMSCLQSLNDVFESVGYATSNDTSGLVSVLSSAVTSYLTQGLPTLLGQAERTGEENRMTTYTEKNSFFTTDMQYALGKASAKIPFWDYNQIPYIDAWGRKEASGNALKRGLNNFLNPAYTSTIETSNMEKELLRLYEKTGEVSVFPSRADKYFTVDEKRKDLTADEYVRYATLKGEKSRKAVTDLVKSPAYKKLSNAEKVKAIEEAYDYANQKAKEAISRYEPDKWVKKADEFGSNISSYLSFRTELSSTKKENGDKISKNEVVDIILDVAQNDSETWKMYLSEYDSTSDLYAYESGIDGETYMYFLEALADVDEPTKSGKYGTYTQDEARNAVNRLNGLSQKEKSVLWQSVNTTWKKNPF